MSRGEPCRCGAVAVRNWDVHRATPKHRLGSAKQDMYDRGMTPAGATWQVLRGAGVPMEEAPLYLAANRDSRDGASYQVTNGVWAPAWAVTVGGCAWTVPAPHRRYWVTALLADAAAREVAVAVHRLGGRPALVLHLEAALPPPFPRVRARPSL